MDQPALRRIAPFLLLVAVPLCASPAFAAGKRARAKRQFNTAEKYYKVGQFQKAIEHYTRAYELVPLAPLLFNLGQCHKQLGNCERAAFYYETFLRESPDAANAPLASELLDECRQTLAATQAPAEAAPEEEPAEEATEEPLPDGESAGSSSELEPSASAASLDPMVAQPAEPGAAFLNPMTAPPAAVVTENESSVFSRWWFWTIVGTAVAAGGVTTYVLLSREDAGTVPPSGSLGTIDTRR